MSNVGKWCGWHGIAQYTNERLGGLDGHISIGVGYGTGVCWGKTSAVSVIRSALVLIANIR